MSYSVDNTSYAKFNSELKLIVKGMGKLQDRINICALTAARQWLVHQNADWAISLVDQLKPLGGSIRVNAIMYWFTYAVGLKVDVDKSGKVTAKKNKTEFDWDRPTDEIFAFGRSNPYYSFAPAEPKLKLPENLSAAALVATAARGMELGEYSEDDVDSFIASIKGEIVKARKSEKTQAWVKEYNAQQSMH